MTTQNVGPTSWHRRIRSALVLGYVGFVVVGFVTEVQPRVFWTMLLPLLPISIVLMGFPTWRRICPLAGLGEIGRRLNRGTQRRVPKILESWFFLVTFGFLLSMLVLRLVATNGDGVWLSGLLVGLAAAAIVTNLVYTGKTWCNFVCPVGLVERIYTEPNSLPETANSQCERCTACKKHCPDIDQENGYWRDVTSTGRRIATFAFPGLVLAFYTYYWLRHGEWEAYFDGRWTDLPVSAELVWGPGFFFAPWIPALGAAILTLVAFSGLSYGVFRLVERAVERLVDDAERRRHLVLAIAAFVAFTTFYFFAGAPSLRQVPGATRAVAFATPLVATLFTVKRWRRRRERYIQERGARRLVRDWPFEEPPPEDAGEVYAWIQADERAHERSLVAYESTVKHMIADGLVDRGELRLLEGVRAQLGITEREHEKTMERLSDEERHLFDEDRVGGVEERAQLEGYETALSAALLRAASDDVLSELRRAFGIPREVHARLLERMRVDAGAMLAKARGQLDRVLGIRRDLARLGPPDQPGGRGMLSFLLRRKEEDALERVVELLEVAGESERVRALRTGLSSSRTETRRSALEELSKAWPDWTALAQELQPLVLEPAARPVDPDPAERDEMLERLATAPDPYVRAATLWTAARDHRDSSEIVERGLSDPHALVRETATMCDAIAGDGSVSSGGFSNLTTIERMEVLRGVPLFAQLDPEDLEDLAGMTSEETIESGGILCEEGDANPDAVFIIVEGLASVVVGGRTDADGSGQELAVLGAGEVVGELSLLDGSPRMATVRAKDGALRVLRVSGELFRSRLLHRSRVTRPLLVTLARRLRALPDLIGTR